MPEPQPKPKRASALWPRPFLIQVHEKAIAEGCCRVEGLSEQEARSFIASFYRLRRRGDSAHKLMLIPEEFHLVMAKYEPDRSSVLFVYDALPDDAGMPKLVSVAESERITAQGKGSAPAAAAPAQLDDLDIATVVEQLADEAQRQHGADPSSELG